MAVNVWSADKTALLPVLEILDLIPARPGIPSSQYIKLEGRGSVLQCSAASEVSGMLSAKGQGQWPFQKPYFVDRRLFLPFLQVAKQINTKAPFEFTTSESQLVVSHGRRKATFDAMPTVSGYGVPPNGDGTALQFNPNLFEVIRCARDSATVDTSVPHLNCVYLNPRSGGGLDVLATNQIVIQQGIPSGKPTLTKALPFPLYLVDLLNHEGIKKIVWREKEVCLHFTSGVIWQTVSVPALKSFPVSGIFGRIVEGRKLPELCRISCRRFGLVVSRLAVYLGSVRKQDWLLEITGKVGSSDLLLEAKVPQGHFRERVPVAQPLEHDVAMEWPLEWLLPVFTYLAKSEEGDLAVHYGESKKVIEKDGKKKVIVQRSPYFLETPHLRLVVARLVKKK